MIACVSPADSNAEETLSTLRLVNIAKSWLLRMGIAPGSADGSLRLII
ncbi:unnamed protein product [Cylicostephanus goldi]|uniref:Kinesin motor domain-containing protein n=1 Tax=Cylicostephanus goldi TaxID=71465 RepID=A0A3P6RX65_CYLGO|nr:unnamed protein product [Cylicostephanus goldi]